MARPKNVVAVTPGGKITLEQVLGWLAMSTVPDQPISGSKLIRTWAGHGLDTTLVPPVRHPINVFQTACRSVETRKRNGHDTEVKVDEIMEDAATCVYQVTRMVRDRDERLIEHPKAMRVTFDKSTEDIDVEPLDPDTYDALAYIEADIREAFEGNKTKVPGHKVRNAVRGLMHQLGASNVRKKSGGVYFVPKDAKGAHKSTLDTLATVLEELYGGDAELWTIPLADDKSEREMVERHFKLNVAEQIEEQIGKVSSVLKNGSYVRKDLLRNVIEDRRRLGELTQEHQSLLRASLSETHDDLSILDEQITLLLEMKDEGEAEAA